jgi:hypothetical protein
LRLIINQKTLIPSNISAADDDDNALVIEALLHIIVDDLTMYIDIPAIAACSTLERMSIVLIVQKQPTYKDEY